MYMLFEEIKEAFPSTSTHGDGRVGGHKDWEDETQPSKEWPRTGCPGHLGVFFPETCSAVSLWALSSRCFPAGLGRKTEAGWAVVAAGRKKVLAPWQEEEAKGPLLWGWLMHTHSCQGWVYHLFIWSWQKRGHGGRLLERGRWIWCARVRTVDPNHRKKQVLFLPVSTQI